MISLKKNLFTSITGMSIEATMLFIRGIIIVKTLSVEDYGTSLIIINFFALLELIFYFRTSDIILKYHYEAYDFGGGESLSTLYFFSAIIPLCVSAMISVPLFYFSSDVSGYLYSDTSIGYLIALYIPAFILTSVNGVTTTALRVMGKYKIVVGIQLIVAFLSLLLIAYFSFIEKDLSLKGVILIFSLTAVLMSLVLLIFAGIEINRKYSLFQFKPNIERFNISFTELRKLFFGVNITAWLKSGGDVGGVFVLGVLTNSNYVAIYGLARQVVRPVALLQTAIYNVIMPEFMKFISKGESNEILTFVHKYILLATAVFLPVLIVFNIYSEEIIHLFSKQEYSGSAYVATILIATSSLTIIFLPFYPVALKLNLIGFRNWISSIRFLYIGLAAWLEMNAVTLAYANLAGVVTVRLLFDSHAYTKIKPAINKG